MILDAKHQEEDQPPREAHKGRWLAYFALAAVFVFALSAVILSPAAIGLMFCFVFSQLLPRGP